METKSSAFIGQRQTEAWEQEEKLEEEPRVEEENSGPDLRHLRNPKTGFLAAAHVFIALFSLSSAFHACLR